MRFLVPQGGAIPEVFGVLTSPSHKGIPQRIAEGAVWAADNGAFTKAFEPESFLIWLKRMEPYRGTCLFVVCPDALGNAKKTLDMFAQHSPYLAGWPVAFVAQDGQEDLDFPPGGWSALFVGGTTRWKLSPGAVRCIQKAQNLGKHIHIGRVNWWRRYQYFASIPGSQEFTCDGTRIRYGKDKAIADWQQYMVAPKQANLFISNGHCVCQSNSSVVRPENDHNQCLPVHRPGLDGA